MRSHQLRTMAVAAAIFAVVVSLAPPVLAQPADPGTSDARERYEELGVQAATTDEDLSEAEALLGTKQRERETADADLAAATQTAEQAGVLQEQFQGTVDEFTSASFRGARLEPMSAALLSSSPQNFLERMSALNVIAGSNAEAMDRYRDTAAQASAGRSNAAAAQQRAQTAAAEAEALVAQVRTRKQDLSGQIAQVRSALAELPAADKAEIGQVQDNGSYLGPPGAANDALQAALSTRGSEYEWAATGPSEFDCSGLTSWAYKQAGVAIPRTSRQQYTAGKAVSLDALQPGDLLFYDDGTGDPGAIHHVGMFVGAGKMVDAPTEGQLVDVRSMRGDGHLMGARRIVG